MDERRLTELFQRTAESAARDAPPPSFDHASVLAAARQARQRRMRLGGIAVAVVAVGVAGVVTATASRSSDNATLAEPVPVTSPASAGGQVATPFAARRGSQDSCEVADQQLYSQLAQLVPAARRATPRPISENAYCPDGARGVEVEITANGAHGVLRVLLSPPGSVGGGSTVQTSGGSISTTTVSTRDGGSLSLTTESSRGAAPYEDQLDDLADELAKQN